MGVDLVLQSLVSGGTSNAGGQPKDLAVLDVDVGGRAREAEDELLTKVTKIGEAALPVLPGAIDENRCDTVIQARGQYTKSNPRGPA